MCNIKQTSCQKKSFNTYASHVDGTVEGTEKTGTENSESGVDKELISGTTKEQESVGRSLLHFFLVWLSI